jgi:chromosome segregation protein
MHLKELRINGFKSFADNTRLDLRPGVTAIVGPNGCGKSNIADAIRWVLGETSAKSLRAGGMQDVIFQGTDSRKALNLCEVSLVFADCEEQLGTAFAEVEVSRRVVRDGGGQYFINGKQCRLKDIQRLFLDTGIGQVSYSFMLQGQIDQILSSNPAERRTIFEEAAGISRYKAQRREALGKLTSVDANLARVTDVMEEVARQIGSLKRQAAKALRYKRIKHRLTHLELAHSAYRANELRRVVRESEDKSRFLRAEADKLKARLEQEEGGLGHKRQRRAEVSAALQEAQQAVFALRNEKDSAQTKAEFAEIRRSENLKRAEDLARDIDLLSRRQADLQDRAVGEARFKDEQLSLFGDSDETFKRKSEELSTLQARLTEAETQLSRDRQAALMKESAITRVRSNCTTLEVDLKSFQVRHANLADEIRQAEGQLAVVTEEQDTLQRAYEARRAQRAQEEERGAERRAQVAALLAEFRALQERITETDRRHATVVAQLNVLEGLQAKLEGFSEGAKAVLQGKLEGIDPADCDVLLKNVQVDPVHARPLENLLGALAEGVVIKDRSRVGPVAAILGERKLGRAHLKFPAPALGVEGARSGGLPAGLTSALSVVKATTPSMAPVVNNLLHDCYFAEELADFLAWWQAHPEFVFGQVATPAGEVIDRRGWVLTAPTKGTKQDRSFLARANEIKAFSGEREILEEQLEVLRQQAARLSEKIERAERDVEDQRKRMLEVTQEVAALESQTRAAARSLQDLHALAERKRRELGNLESQKEASERRLASGQDELRKAENDLAAQRLKVEQAELRVTELREEREQQRESFNDIRVEMAEKKQRLAALERGLSEIAAQTREVEERKQRHAQERANLEEQNAALETERTRELGRIGEIEKTLAVTMATLEKQRAALKAVEAEIETVEKGLSGQRETYDRLTREMGVVDVKLAREQSQAQFLDEEMRREYEVDLRTVNWREQLWLAGDALPERIRVDIEEDSLDDPDPNEHRGEPTAENLAAMETTDWQSVAEEVETLRSKLHSIGAVNLVAIEEYKELNERYTFLKTQSDDLWAAKDELLKAIDEINATSQELFSNTFEQIRKNFIFTFDQLFGGGRSDLHLVDEGDVLESGIDIIAQPPGTKLRTLQLLSGGQKTMTAVALLFAVYMVKPSPFCVLDELDAPLDDANIGRFCKMLESFLEYSQFLIITHNKRTISVADTLYGVTMQERGVSRLVSMRFNRDSGRAEEAPVSSRIDAQEAKGDIS